MRISTPAEQFLIFTDISGEIFTIEDLTQNCILIGIFSFFIFLGISNELKTSLTAILTNTELLQRQRFYCVLSVSSRRAAIAEKDLKNLFKRFYRIDKDGILSRSITVKSRRKAEKE